MFLMKRDHNASEILISLNWGKIQPRQGLEANMQKGCTQMQYYPKVKVWVQQKRLLENNKLSSSGVWYLITL